MPSYVCKGAKLKCSMGDTQSDLNVTHPVNRVIMEGQPMASTMDYKPMMNIMPFGKCRSLANPTVAMATAACFGRLQPMPCVPNITSPWTVGKLDVSVKGQPALMDDCKLFCTYAGIIEIATDGQATPGCVKTGASGIEMSRLTKHKNPPIIRIYWIDKQENGARELSELEEKKEVTLCVEVEDGGEGESLDVEISAPQGQTFKNGQISLKFENLMVGADNMAYVNNFSYELNKD